MTKEVAQVDWSAVTADQGLNLLLAMQQGNPPEELEKALSSLPKMETPLREKDKHV